MPALSAYSQDVLPKPLRRSSASVVEVNSDYVVIGPTVHKVLLGEMIDTALQAATKKNTTQDAWRALLRDRAVVGLKFNTSAQQIIGTSSTLAGVLIESLMEAGWPLDRIVCIEAPKEVITRYQTRPVSPGFQATTANFGSGSDHLARVLDQITAIINVPFLKTHNIAMLTCCLKNLSHGLIQHPARFHGQGCSPYIADIVALPAIRDKLRINIVDALRVVYKGGPSASNDSIVDHGSILVSTDPVAMDAVGVSILNDIRSRERLTSVAVAPEKVPYLAHAQALGLGVAKLFDIDFDRMRMG